MKKIIKTLMSILLLQSSWAVYSLSASENLGIWRNTPSPIQESLCEAMIDKINDPGLTSSALCNCISETAGNGGLDNLKIAEIAASCAILIRESQ
ncbi:hypothetical protein Lrub_0718 [Legionella rubrilucens]|uniref:Uncharacterized protein n=1 Tax=Legionella rubrilucens TaxID=458 RepID=A0A0W0XV68_9GAMM|nr:hypothetical protein [Legionella rubrilucens]KTD48367.1 hypothetical protein Lrub_0718 [Legionella rubrilucens]